jgi:hypothetical protein
VTSTILNSGFAMRKHCLIRSRLSRQSVAMTENLCSSVAANVSPWQN